MTSEELIEILGQYADENGVDELLDIIADVHMAFAVAANDPVIRQAYELAGIDIDEVDEDGDIIVEHHTVQ